MSAPAARGLATAKPSGSELAGSGSASKPGVENGQPALDSAAGTATAVSGDREAIAGPVGPAAGTQQGRASDVGTRSTTTDEVRLAQSPPKRSPTGITITAPTDGLRLGPDDPPLVVVQGEVEDPSTTQVSLTVNGRRVRVPVADRRFRHVVPVLESVVRLRAEGTTGDPPGQSSTITVHGAGSAAPALMLVLDGPAPSSSPIELGATWRSNAARVDIPAYPVALKSIAPGPAMPSAVFYTRGLQAGVYTLALRSDAGGAGVPAAGTLYLLRDGQLSVRSLNPDPATRPRRVLVRLLMPYGVLWDQDEWFTGQSQNADTMTKFRFPDGVSWVERKGNLAR